MAADLRSVLDGMRVVSLPMRVRFRGIETREVALVEGPAGWGEFGPFLEYGPQEAARWLAAALESAYAEWPAPVREVVPVNATVPAVPAAEVSTVLRRFPGCATAKVKVAEPGQSIEDDLDRVAAVRAELGRNAAVRVDANGGWAPEEAVEALARLSAYDLEYAEQPAATVAGLREVRLALARRGIAVPVAADESIRKASDPGLVAREEAADLVVVKVAPLGGVRRALDVVAECGLPAVVSSALDTSVGIGAGLALAAALPDLDHACGLGTVGLLGADVTPHPLLPVGGVLRPRRVEPDPDLLDRHAASPERVRWWRERIADCWAVLAQGQDGEGSRDG